MRVRHDPRRLRAVRTRKVPREPVVHPVRVRGVEVLRVEERFAVPRHHVYGPEVEAVVVVVARALSVSAVAGGRHSEPRLVVREVIGAFVVSRAHHVRHVRGDGLDVPEKRVAVAPVGVVQVVPQVAAVQHRVREGENGGGVVILVAFAFRFFQGRAISRMLRDVTRRAFFFATRGVLARSLRAVDLAHDRAYRARGLEVPDVAPRQHPEGGRRRDLRLRPLRAEREPAREGGFGGFVFFARRVCFRERRGRSGSRAGADADAVRVRRARAEAAQGGEVYVTHQVLVAAVHERAGYARGVERRAVFTDQPILHERGFLLERHVPDDHAVVVAPEREVHALGVPGREGGGGGGRVRERERRREEVGQGYAEHGLRGKEYINEGTDFF